MDKLALVLTTVPSEAVAASISDRLVNERLAACVNAIPSVMSVYFWENKLCKEKEVLLVIKSLNSQLDRLEKRLKDLHPYKVFEFVVLCPARVAKNYLEWVGSSCDCADGK